MRDTPPVDLADLIPEDDGRIVSDRDAVEVARPRWAALLLAGRYISASNEPDMWRRLHEELVHQLMNGGMPPDIHRGLYQAAKDNGGWIPMVVSDDNVLVAPMADGGMRITTSSTDGYEHMQFGELESDEVADLLGDTLSTRDFHEMLVRLADLGSFDAVESIAAVAQQTDAVSADDLRAIADEMDGG